MTTSDNWALWLPLLGFFFPVCVKKRLQSTSTSILESGSLPFQRSVSHLCIFMYKCLQGSCLWTLSVNLMSEYYILACVLDCLTSDKLCMPEPRPMYSSRVSWHCLPWSVIISNKVVSELVSENQTFESSSWSTLSDSVLNATSAA